MRFSIRTKGFNDTIDITGRVSELVEKIGKKEGICLISCPGSTCGITMYPLFKYNTVLARKIFSSG